jgi:hypothetical protein
MGEAKRRRERQQRHRERLTPEVKREIAQIARSVYLTMPAPGGLCMFRVACGCRVLDALGLPFSVAVGGVACRVGPDEYADLFTFAAPDLCGTIMDNLFLGHAWLQVGDDLVDFSVGDWRAGSERAAGTPLEVFHVPAGLEVIDRRIEWTIDLPEYHWAPVAHFRPPLSEKILPDEFLAALPLGKVIYTPWIGPDPGLRIKAGLREFAGPEFRWISDLILSRLRESGLIARLSSPLNPE